MSVDHHGNVIVDGSIKKNLGVGNSVLTQLSTVDEFAIKRRTDGKYLVRLDPTWAVAPLMVVPNLEAAKLLAP